MPKRTIYALLLMLLLVLPVSAQQKHADTEKLGMALEYFASGKYHEALLLFQRLDRDYKLNARFRAYIGLCYYHEWDYKKACQYLDELIPQLDPLAPHERSVYYYAAAESHFNLQQYAEAIPYYEKVLGVCFDREKGDAFYRLGFCYMFLGQWANARDNFQSSQSYYVKFRNTPDLEGRLAQLTNMIKGCEKQMPESDLYIEPKDTIATDSILTDSILTDSILTDSTQTDSIHTDSTQVDSIAVDTAATVRSSCPQVGIDETQRHQVFRAADHIDTVRAIEQDAHRLPVAVFDFNHHLPTGTAGRDRIFQHAVLVAGSYRQSHNRLVGVLGLCGKDGGALGTKS